MTPTPTPFQRLAFALRARLAGLGSRLRLAGWRAQGLRAGPGTRVGRIGVTWPHQVALGRNCLLEDGVTFKYHGPADAPAPAVRLGDGVFVGRGCEFNLLVGAEIGPQAMLAAGCRLVDHDHGMVRGDVPIARQPARGERIHVGAGAWLGANVVVLKGGRIGEGAVVAAGAVVTRPVPAGEIWGGVPARRLGVRPAAATQG